VTKLSSATPKARADGGREPVERLTRRRQFLAVAKGKRCHAAAFTLQSAPGGASTGPTCDIPPRFGITVTKKIGGAIVRNRIRRRLRAALIGLAPLPARPGHDYVIVARRDALAIPFAELKGSLAKALVRIDGASAKTDSPKSASGTLLRKSPAAPGSTARPPRKDRTGKAPKE
jgi:ribonuclease P protein component